jgi:hypothetical protein
MFKKLLMPALCVVSLFACKKSEDTSIDSFSTETIVLAERGSNKPFILADKSLLKRSEKQRLAGVASVSNETLSPSDYLGRSYTFATNEFGSPEGVKYPVIDMQKYSTDFPDYMLPKYLGISTATTYAFSWFDRMQNKTNKTVKINGGFNLNLGLFSIGAKNVYTNTFSSEVTETGRRTYGLLEVLIKDSSYEFLLSSNVLERVKKSYLKQSFKDELYNTHSSEFLRNYGNLVITGVITGGKATAIFAGRYDTESSTEVREKNMENTVNASFTFKDKPAASTADFTLGNIKGSTIARENNLFDFKASVRTYGGSYGFGGFTVPKSIDDINIDFSSWTGSMNDKSKHVLVDFVDNGTMPLANLVEEENLKYYLNKSLDQMPVLRPLMEPQIEGRWIRMSNQVVLATIVLRTRFGDELKISDNVKPTAYDRTPEGIQHMLTFALQEAQTKLPFYKLKVVANGFNEIDLYHNSAVNYLGSIVGIGEASMKKFFDASKNVWYLLSTANGKNFAYAVHYDYLFDTYGIRSWVNSMSTTTLTTDQLKTYKIIAL